MVAGKSNPYYLPVSREIITSLKKEKISLKEYSYTLDAGEKSEDFIADIKNVSPDLIVTIGPWQTEFMAQNFKNIPIVFTMVYHIDLMDQIMEETPLMRGVYINLDMQSPFSCLKTISPSLKKIGLIYSRRFFSRIVPGLKESAFNSGLELIARPIDNETSLPGALESLIFRYNIQAFYFLPDPILLRRSAMKKIMLLSMTRNFYVFSEYYKLLENGALASFSFKTDEVVQKTTALMMSALGIAGREKEKQTQPSLQCREYELILNENMVKAFELSIPDGIRMKSVSFKKIKAEYAVS
ncbi:MAG: hypothetical protein JW774_08055 [Candidatus Aureabacteria bacterium]|nr:hypothetical protein [Candidatus Auribacterota bacterium]